MNFLRPAFLILPTCRSFRAILEFGFLGLCRQAQVALFQFTEHFTKTVLKPFRVGKWNSIWVLGISYRCVCWGLKFNSLVTKGTSLLDAWIMAVLKVAWLSCVCVCAWSDLNLPYRLFVPRRWHQVLSMMADSSSVDGWLKMPAPYEVQQECVGAAADPEGLGPLMRAPRRPKLIMALKFSQCLLVLSPLPNAHCGSVLPPNLFVHLLIII